MTPVQYMTPRYTLIARDLNGGITVFTLPVPEYGRVEQDMSNGKHHFSFGGTAEIKVYASTDQLVEYAKTLTGKEVLTMLTGLNA